VIHRTSKSATWLGAAFALAIAASAGPALGASPADRAAAQALFDDGMRSMAQQRYADACPKLEESNRLDPAIGTRFNLADCYEHVGKTASAWTVFLDVAAATRAAGQADREQVARDRARALEAGLSRLTIAVTQRDLPGLEIKRDGGVVGQPLWGTPVPIDPGDHVLVASAPGKTSWQATVRVERGGGSAMVTVPALQDGPAGAAGVSGSTEPGAPDVAARGWSTQRYVGVAVAGAGVLAIGAGSVLGLMAKSKNDEAHTGMTNCPLPNECRPLGVALIHQAEGLATGSTVAFIAGGVLAAGGAVLFFTAPPARAATADVALRGYVGPGGAGASVGGRF
jgi:hypothetical protein